MTPLDAAFAETIMNCLKPETTRKAPLVLPEAPAKSTDFEALLRSIEPVWFNGKSMQECTARDLWYGSFNIQLHPETWQLMYPSERLALVHGTGYIKSPHVKIEQGYETELLRYLLENEDNFNTFRPGPYEFSKAMQMAPAAAAKVISLAYSKDEKFYHKMMETQGSKTPRDEYSLKDDLKYRLSILHSSRMYELSNQLTSPFKGWVDSDKKIGPIDTGNKETYIRYIKKHWAEMGFTL